jgi:hypothetical protein
MIWRPQHADKDTLRRTIGISELTTPTSYVYFYNNTL